MRTIWDYVHSWENYKRSAERGSKNELRSFFWVGNVGLKNKQWVKEVPPSP